MSRRDLWRCAALLSVVLLWGTVPSTFAQRGAQAGAADRNSPVRIRDVVWQGNRAKMPTPEFRNSISSGLSIVKEWWQLTVEYDVDPPERRDWLDDLTFDYYVLSLKAEQGRRAYTFYKKRVTYLDIEKGRGRRATMYLRPDSLERYGWPVAVAVEISYGGAVVAREAESSITLPEMWWKDARVVEREGVSVRSGALLNRAQTPFALIDIDAYEAIK